MQDSHGLRGTFYLLQSWEQYQDKIDAIVDQAMHVGAPGESAWECQL